MTREDAKPAETTTYRGVDWKRDSVGRVSFFDSDAKRWVRWAANGDAPPLPPKWSLLGVPTKVTRPGWRSRWRLIPLVLVVAAVIFAVVQVEGSSGDAVAKEAAAAKALLGTCLAQKGTVAGHPEYSGSVPCGSKQAAVKIVEVLPGTPGGPLCPSGTTGFRMAYAGVEYPHILCTRPV